MGYSPKIAFRFSIRILLRRFHAAVGFADASEASKQQVKSPQLHASPERKRRRMRELYSQASLSPGLKKAITASCC